MTWRDRSLLAEAGVWLAVSRLVVVLVPFRIVSRHLGTHMAETSYVATTPDLSRVAWAVGAVARRTPWRSKCLEQAIAAKAMLRGRGIENTLYLGLTKEAADEGSEFLAHAWLRCGMVHVTGGADVARYTVLSTFADAPPS